MSKHLNREVAIKMEFDEPGTFQSMYAAQGWLSCHGYTYGSTSAGNSPVAIRKGEYDLPQKWHNINDAGRDLVDGVMYCEREGKAIIYIFENNLL